jgi:co-chaperonin GroES (HSP10)
MISLRPIRDWILVKPLVDPTDEEGFRRSEGGIILLAAQRPESEMMTIDVEGEVSGTEAEVVAVGPGLAPDFDMWDIKPGDVIQHSPNGCPYFEFEGAGYRFLRRDSIVGLVG